MGHRRTDIQRNVFVQKYHKERARRHNAIIRVLKLNFSRNRFNGLFSSSGGVLYHKFISLPSLVRRSGILLSFQVAQHHHNQHRIRRKARERIYSVPVTTRNSDHRVLDHDISPPPLLAGQRRVRPSVPRMRSKSRFYSVILLLLSTCTFESWSTISDLQPTPPSSPFTCSITLATFFSYST